MSDFDAMTGDQFEAHPDTPAKRDYIARVYRAANRASDPRATGQPLLPYVDTAEPVDPDQLSIFDVLEAGESGDRCRHCCERIRPRETPLGGRYRWSGPTRGTGLFGSECECPRNDRGHEPMDTP